MSSNNIIKVLVAIIGAAGVIIAALITGIFALLVEQTKTSANATTVAATYVAQRTIDAPLPPPTYAPQPTFTRLPTYTPYPTPTLAPLVLTSTPILNPPTRTVTPTPTFTSLPTPSVKLPFIDTFAGGLRPEWIKVRGKPLIVRGRLSPGNDLLEIELGNNFGNRYVIEFDYSDQNHAVISYQRLYVIIAQHLRFTFGPFDCGWEEYNNGGWTNIGWSGGGWSGDGHFKMTVTGSKYVIPYAGHPNIEIVSEPPLIGPIGLIIIPGPDIPMIWNFSIKSQ